jgi:urease accessory protein UreF
VKNKTQAVTKPTNGKPVVDYTDIEQLRKLAPEMRLDIAYKLRQTAEEVMREIDPGTRMAAAQRQRREQEMRAWREQACKKTKTITVTISAWSFGALCTAAAIHDVAGPGEALELFLDRTEALNEWTGDECLID